MLLLSAALCSSTAFLLHQPDFSARVRFRSSLQASLYAAMVNLVFLVCNTLWWAWSLLLIRICSSWSLGSNQSWCFLSGLPRFVLAVLYTTCCRAAHSSSGVELYFSSHWARALSISCSKLSLRLRQMLSDRHQCVSINGTIACINWHHRGTHLRVSVISIIFQWYPSVLSNNVLGHTECQFGGMHLLV